MCFVGSKEGLTITALIDSQLHFSDLLERPVTAVQAGSSAKVLENSPRRCITSSVLYRSTKKKATTSELYV